MNEVQTDAYQLIHRLYHNGVKPLIVENEKTAYIKDPGFDIKRNRVIAETIKAIIRLDLEKNEVVAKLFRYLETTQNTDGSWNEVHPNYNNPSALITAIVGEAFIYGIEKGVINDTGVLQKARDYVLENEIAPGYFLKSEKFTADHLNVDATCGAFLAVYGASFHDKSCVDAARRAAKRIYDNQVAATYPYTIDKGSYAYTLNVPCIHYQGVTMYYLAKIQDVIKEAWITQSLVDAGEWLTSVQTKKGTFDWSKSGLLFAYYLIGAYAFAYSSFVYLLKDGHDYVRNAQWCLDVLDAHIDTISLRWEKESWVTFVPSLLTAVTMSLIGRFPLTHRLYRFAYAVYREYARRGFSDEPQNDRMFTNVVSLLDLQYSVIEPSRNYHDLFMTSEILDCLSQSIQWQEESTSG